MDRGRKIALNLRLTVYVKLKYNIQPLVASVHYLTSTAKVNT